MVADTSKSHEIVTLPFEQLFFGDSVLTGKPKLRPLAEVLKYIPREEMKFGIWLVYQYKAGPLNDYMHKENLVNLQGGGRDEHGVDMG